MNDRIRELGWGRHRLGLLGLILLFLGVLAPQPALAEDVTVGGRVIMRLPAPKAATAQQKIDRGLRDGANPEGVLAKKTPHGYGVYWGEVLIVEIDKALAAENKSTPEGLAVTWAQRLYDLVGPGFFSVSPTSLTLAVTSTSTLRFQGIATGPISIEGGEGIVTTSVDSVGGTVDVKAVAVGRSTLVIKREHRQLRIPIRVKDWAGYPPNDVSLKVTGNPAPGQIVMEAALTEIASKTRLNPGARLVFPADLPQIPSVPRGQSLKLTLPIEILGGEDYYPVKATVKVQVQSFDLKIEEPNLLVVSNRPERVDRDGVLMEYTFSQHEPTRLMYSHLNESDATRELWVNLYNETDKPAEVWIGSSFAGPSRSEVQAGHMAAVRFLRQQGSQAGYLVEIPAGKRFVVADHLLARKDLLSGFANFQIVSGEKLRVEVYSTLTLGRNDTRGVTRIGGPFNPFKIHPHGVFAQPYFEEWVDMTEVSDPVAVPYGISPWLIDFETGLPNTGNFGVLYRYNFVLANASNRTVDFELVFKPTAGPAAGTFLVDGDLLEAKFAKAGVETSLGRFRVEPNTEQTINVATLPEASSNYPAYLEMRVRR